MRVAQKRWGEVTIKKQGTKGKNSFDKTKSFSVQQVGKKYQIEEYVNILKEVTNLSQDLEYDVLLNLLKKITPSQNKSD